MSRCGAPGDGGLFDLAMLSQAVDAERQEQALSWAGLAREVGVAASTIRRYGTAADAEADGVLALIRWLGVTPEMFVDRAALRGANHPGGTLLPASGSGYVRVDMDVVDAAAGKARASGRTRTTIQRLVAVAVAADQPIASLTRRSPV